MSLFNFLGLDNEVYGKYAKGILYVVYEIFWKIIYAVNSLIDVVTGLFYKIAGVTYLGSGSETLVEEQDLLSKLFNQNIVSGVSFFMIIVSILLMAVFGTSAVLKKLYFSKEDGSSVAEIIKNMVLGFLFLVCLTPIALFAISSISTLTAAIGGMFGDNSNVSLADLIFNISFSGDAIGAYNTMYATEIEAETMTAITNWTEIKNDFLFDLVYGSVDTGVTFYWYIFLLGGGVVLYNLIVIVFRLVKRIFSIIILYLTAPVYVARMADDGGVKFREWKNKALSELISVVGTVIAFMILISLVGVINNLEIVEMEVSNSGSTGDVIESIMLLADETVEVNTSGVLTNNLTKMLLLMAGTSVAKDSGELLGNIFKGANDESNTLLEGIFNRLGPKEGTQTNKAQQTSPRTRVITKNTTTTRKVIDYSEIVPSRENEKSNSNNVTNNRNTFNANVTNVDRRVNNIQNRTEVSVSGDGRNSDTGAKKGNYRGTDSKGVELLNQQLTSGFKRENDKIRNEWNFVKGNNSASSQEVVREFESASKDLDSSISSGEQNKIKNSMNKYVEAYRKEEKVAKEGYRDFSVKSSKLSSDLSAKQQEELKKISSSYRKAQVEYSKTARKLNEVSQGNMSTTDALRVKERADKQREKLMEASSRASDFYNNQKKGV